MGNKIIEVLNAKVLGEILQEGTPVEEVVEQLFLKGTELAQKIPSREYADWQSFLKAHLDNNTELAELEGTSTVEDADVVVLKACPMASEMAKLNVNGKPPAFHKQIIDSYMQQNPGSNSLLHPGCIAHQVARQIMVKHMKFVSGIRDLNYYQLACRSGLTGKIVYDENGLIEMGMSQEQAEKPIDGHACLYVLIKS
jgi:hypothetical protein